jgi:hypothetical protein
MEAVTTLLICLLREEFLVLSLFVIIYFYLCLFNYELYFVIFFFLVFSVCEGALGLSILVSIIRGFGMIIFSLTECYGAKVFILSCFFNLCFSGGS